MNSLYNVTRCNHVLLDLKLPHVASVLRQDGAREGWCPRHLDAGHEYENQSLERKQEGPAVLCVKTWTLRLS